MRIFEIPFIVAHAVFIGQMKVRETFFLQAIPLTGCYSFHDLTPTVFASMASSFNI